MSPTPTGPSLTGSGLPRSCGGSRTERSLASLRRSLPRKRGGVSHANDNPAYPRVSSPHARGCRHGGAGAPQPERVLPVGAGVLRRCRPGHATAGRLPRTRGGVSHGLVVISGLPVSSPHARGVSRKHWVSGIMAAGLPRTRGGASDVSAADELGMTTSSRARGWLRRVGSRRAGDHGLSAWAEVCHTTGSDCGCSTAVLCIRGGVSFGQPFRFMA